MATQIKPPIDIRFPDNSDSRFFSTYEQLKEWAEKEQEAWEGFKGRIEAIGIPPGINLTLQTHEIGHIVTHATEGDRSSDRRDRILNYFLEFNKKPCVRAESPRGIHLLGVAENDPLLAIGLLAAWNPGVLDWNRLFSQMPHDVQYQNTFKIWINGLGAAQIFDQGISGFGEAEKSAFAEIREKFSRTLDEYRGLRDQTDREITERKEKLDALHEENVTKTKETIEETEKSLGELKNETESDFTKLKEWYEEGLRSEIPITYWTKKAEYHKKAAKQWGKVFVVLILVVLGVFFYEYKDLVDNILELKTEGEIFSLPSLVVLLVPAFLVVWVLRVVAKLLNSHIVRMHDASERAVMTETFVALLQREMATKEDRVLILHSLFRPTSHAPDDDSAPPSWFDILLTRLKSGG